MKYKFTLFLISLIGLFSMNSFAQNDSKGKEFWIGITTNYGISNIKLFISSEKNTSGTINCSGASYNSSFNVSAGLVSEITLPNSVVMNKGIGNKGIHIVAEEEITIYGLNYMQYSTDAFLALPCDILGTEYMIMSYQGLGSAYPSAFGVVATEDGTELTYSSNENTSETINLNKGGSFYYESNQTNGGDLSGTSVISNKPIAVYGGVKIANITQSCSAADYIVEQLPPTSSWGKNFIALPTAGRGSASYDVYRILANTDNTAIFINKIEVITLNKGEFYEFKLSNSAAVSTSKTALLAQFAIGASCVNGNGDPFMTIIPPREQFLNSYFFTSVTGFESQHINIVAPDYAINNIRLDNNLIDPSNFHPIENSGYQGAQLTVNTGSHTVLGDFPIGVFSYGWNYYNSYGYPAGTSLSPVATVSNVTLTPLSVSENVGNNTSFTANVTDQYGNPVNNVLVNFMISGINAGQGFAYSDASGNAVYTYASSTGGNDNIYAEIFGFTSATATVNWIDNSTPPVVTTQAVSSITGTMAIGNGNVTDLGTTDPTQHGFCWNTTGSPTIADNTTSQGTITATGTFSGTISGLTKGHTYYLKAYATNSIGTSYGNEVIFTTKMAPPGNALHFDGINDKVDLGDNIILGNTFTQEAWILPALGDAGYHFVMGNNDGGTSNRPPCFYVYDYDKIHFGFSENGGGTWIASSTPSVLTNYEWNHIALTFDGSAYKVYVNGNLVHTYMGAAGMTPMAKPVKYLAKADNIYTGMMDEVRIWNDVRTIEEIRTYMKRDLEGHEANLLAYHNFDHLSGNILKDWSTNTNHGTLINMADDDWTTSDAMILNPVATEATFVGCDSFTANWEPNHTTSKYILDISAQPEFNTYVPGFEHKEITDPAVTSQEVTGLSNGTTYYYKLKAINDYTGQVSFISNTKSVTINDSQAPVVLTKDITVSLDANGQAGITSTDIDNGSFDNCGIATMTLDITAFDCSNVGENTVMLTVVDVNGNSASNTAIVTIEDNINPTVLTQNITIQLDA
ncbi:MAG: hypothetical protein JEZ03_12185, partial [Bacteroidales bacterium]|nr:hypothetical protein [Bacteroidales bacterium]